MRIQLSEHFSLQKLLRFTLPSIFMMIFTSIYGVVDGFFVSNWAGKEAFTAVNFIYPFLMILSATGFMFGTGGSALIAKTMGQGDPQKARGQFSLLVYATLASGVLLAVAGILALRPVALWMGADDAMADDCVLYGRIILAALPFISLQFAFQSFFPAAEKPNLGLLFTVIAGLTNILGDALLVAVLDLRLVGAAAATAISQVVGGALPLLYFALPNKSLLRLGRARLDGSCLLKACTNGSSELLSNISMSLVGMLYNTQLMRYAGKDGVAAYGVLMYVNLIFLSIFIGYSVGSAPIISYHFGAENRAELKNLLKKSLTLIGATALAMVAAALLLAAPLSHLYVGYDPGLLDLTLRGFRVCSFAFLFSGFAIFGSSFFTALNNGPVSALISFLRTLVFQVAAVFLLPLLWGTDGIWLSIVAADALAAAVTAFLLLQKRKRYGYL